MLNIHAYLLASRLFVFSAEVTNVVVPVHVLPIRLVVDFVAAAATEERQSRRWQQANSTAVAVTFLQAQHKEATRLAGVRKGGYRKQNYLYKPY